MRLRRTFLIATLAAGGMLVGCQDPRGEGMKRKEALTAIPSQEFPGQRFKGGFEDPSAVGKARPNEGVTSVQQPAPRYDPRMQDLPGIGGSGDNPLASDEPQTPVPSNTWGDYYRGAPDRDRNSAYWGPSAPEPSGDAPERPDLRLTE